jgi:hypothetical protein
VRYHQAHGLDRRDLPKANGIAGLDWQTIVHSNFDPQRFSAAVANRARPQQGFEYEHKKGRGMNTEYDDLGDFAEVCRQADSEAGRSSINHQIDDKILPAPVRFRIPPAAGSCIPRGSENSAKLARL